MRAIGPRGGLTKGSSRSQGMMMNIIIIMIMMMMMDDYVFQ